MQKINLVILAYVLFVSCSFRKESSIALSDSTSLTTDSTSAVVGAAAHLWPDLDVEHFKVYDYADTTIDFKESSLFAGTDSAEQENLKSDHRVKRSAEGLEFQLANGKLKILKNNDDDSEDYVKNLFVKSLNEVGQWQILSVYYEGFSYLLIDQHDGTESLIWGEPAFSPDKKYFLAGSADIDAGFVPNGFQMWTFKNNKPTLLWEKELTDWGADNLIWTADNYVLGEQTYRDADLGESNKRIIKMRLLWPE